MHVTSRAVDLAITVRRENPTGWRPASGSCLSGPSRSLGRRRRWSRIGVIAFPLSEWPWSSSQEGHMDHRVSCRRCDLVLVSPTDKLRDEDVDLVLVHCQVVHSVDVRHMPVTALVELVEIDVAV